MQHTSYSTYTRVVALLVLKYLPRKWVDYHSGMGSGASSYHSTSPHSPSTPSSSLTTSSPKSYHLPCPRRQTFHSLFRSTTPKLSDYYIGSIIGQGGFGKIREIKRKKDSCWFALKIFEFETMTLKEAQAVVAELLGLSRIPSHPFIIQLHAAFRLRSSISFIMDLFVGGDLRMVLRTGDIRDETKIAYIIACIGSALHHIHEHQVIHRDVKPENIMFTTQGIPKLIDFGVAYVSPTSSPVCVCESRSGTPQYMSPELFVSKTHYHSYEADFWSLGIVMYEMLYSCRPFETRVAPPLIRYSEETYASVWKSLLNLTVIDNGARETPAPTTTITSVIPSNWDYSHQNAPSPSSIDWSSYFAEEDSPSQLSHDIRIPFPELSTTLNSPPSEDCISLLVSLLDARIHKRCGVGENYSCFSQHPFFVSRRMNGDQLLSFPSPINTDMTKIGINLWNQFFASNLEEEINPQSSDPFPLSKEVEDYFQEIQSVTPLFYQSNGDGTRRDMKFMASAEGKILPPSS